MNTDALRRMRDLGLTFDEAIELADMLAPKRSKGAERQARYRAKQTESVTCDVTSDATSDRNAAPTPPSSEPKGSSEKGNTTRTREPRKSRRCPDAWKPTEADLAHGAHEGFSPGEIERELTRMRNHEFKTARSDWSATFQNWLSNAADRRPRTPNGPHERPNQNYRDDKLSRAGAGAMAYLDECSDTVSRDRFGTENEPASNGDYPGVVARIGSPLRAVR